MRSRVLISLLAAASFTFVREPPRPFVAGELLVGGAAKAQVVAGWGQPRWAYFGVETWVLTTAEFASQYVGIIARMPFLEFTVGQRVTQSYLRGFLPVQTTYSDLPLEGDRTRIRSLDMTLLGFFPVPGGFFNVWGELTHPLGLSPSARYFDELFRVVGSGSGAGILRGTYIFELLGGALRIGPMIERVGIAGRNVGFFRAGGAASYAFHPRLSLLGLFTTPIDSPDQLGRWNRLWGTLVLRWVWATGGIYGSR